VRKMSRRRSPSSQIKAVVVGTVEGGADGGGRCYDCGSLGISPKIARLVLVKFAVRAFYVLQLL